MTKPVIVTRLGKGSELTFQEGDDNFSNLQNATVTVAGDSGTSQAVDLNGTITVAGGTGLSTAMSSGTVTVNLDNTAVTAGSYTKASITVDEQGRVTSASNGSADFSTSDARSAISAGTGISYSSSTGVIASTITQYTDANAKAAITAGTGITVTEGVVATTITQYADSDARAALSAGTGISYNSSTGAISSSITQYTDSDARAALSASQNLSYNSSTGAFTGPDLSGYQTTLAFTPEDSANKNANNGYAGLDANGKVATAQLPSYVDDVVEAANFAGLPTEGETGKIYVALDNGKVYRWSGTAYVEISPSPGSTDSVTEGSTNLYFTTTRARDSFSAGTGITITGGAIATTITQYADADARAALSAGTGISYNSSTGAISSTITQYADSDARAALSAGTGISYNSSTGVITSTVTAFDPASPGDIGGTTPAAVTATTLTSTGRTVIKDLTETVYSLTYGATITPNVANGTVQKVTLTGNVTFSAFTSPVAGQSLTLIVTQDGTGSRTLTSTMKFAGGTKTLSTAAGSIDIITVFYDGTNYYASLGKGFA